jgi:hypothetical protein
LLLLGEIADKAGEVGHPARLHFPDRKMHRKRRAVPALPVTIRPMPMMCRSLWIGIGPDRHRGENGQDLAVPPGR